MQPRLPYSLSPRAPASKKLRLQSCHQLSTAASTRTSSLRLTIFKKARHMGCLAFFVLQHLIETGRIDSQFKFWKASTPRGTGDRPATRLQIHPPGLGVDENLRPGSNIASAAAVAFRQGFARRVSELWARVLSDDVGNSARLRILLRVGRRARARRMSPSRSGLRRSH